MDIGLLLLRLTVGLTLAAHGRQKLFGWFGGSGLDATGEALATLGFHPGRRYALMAGLGETGGGVFFGVRVLYPPGAGKGFFPVFFGGRVRARAARVFFLGGGGCGRPS